MPPRPPKLPIPTSPTLHLHTHLARKPPTHPSHPRHRPISTYGYTQAKSLIYTRHGSPHDVLSLHTHSLPPPHSTLLTLRTLAAPLNPADVNQISGTYASLPPFTNALGTPNPAAVPGNEAVFEILAKGAGVRGVGVGDWVIPRKTGMGTWRTHLQVAEDRVMGVGKEVDRKSVAQVGVNWVTAWCLLRNFAGGEGWFIQNGANSGVGRAVLQLGRRWGRKGIAVIRERGNEDATRALKEELRELGAEVVVTDREVAEKGFGERVREWTRGEEIKLGLNCVGGQSAMDIAKTLSPGASLVTYGAMSKNPLRVGAGMLIFKDLKFEGFWVSRWAERFPEERERVVREVLELMRRGVVREGPVVEVGWEWGSGREELVGGVEGTLEGFRRGKGVFVFGDT